MLVLDGDGDPVGNRVAGDLIDRRAPGQLDLEKPQRRRRMHGDLELAFDVEG